MLYTLKNYNMIEHFNISTLRNTHQGESCVILGCGPSVKNFEKYKNDFFTIGVNDIGEFHTPDILLLLDVPTVFTPERRKTIENTPSKIFTSNVARWETKAEKYVDFRIGSRSLKDIDKNFDDGRLCVSSTSTYVGIVLAYYMGFKRIGMIGVDFTQNHYNRKDGVHSLNKKLQTIQKAYTELEALLKSRGVEFYNLSKDSAIDTTKMSVEDFVSQK